LLASAIVNENVSETLGSFSPDRFNQTPVGMI